MVVAFTAEVAEEAEVAWGLPAEEAEVEALKAMYPGMVAQEGLRAATLEIMAVMVHQAPREQPGHLSPRAMAGAEAMEVMLGMRGTMD